MSPKRTPSQQGRASREKGKRAELAVRDIFREFGFNGAERVPNSGGLYIPGDIDNIPDLFVEVKHCETWKTHDWLKKAQEECPDDRSPVLICRRNHSEWIAMLRLTDWLSSIT